MKMEFGLPDLMLCPKCEKSVRQESGMFCDNCAKIVRDYEQKHHIVIYFWMGSKIWLKGEKYEI